MNPLNSEYFVKHREFSREQLNGKNLALCQRGHIIGCHIRASAPRGDGCYILHTSSISVAPPHSEDEGSVEFREESLDQATVDKIVTVEADCDLKLMRFDFAVIRDAESGFLIKTRPS